MKEEHPNPADQKKETGKDAKAAFYEKLLTCSACGKIYFSRRPIALLTFTRKNYYICADCSALILCSRCNEPIRPEAALVAEDHAHNKLEYLCSSCRDSVIITSRLLGIRTRLGRGRGSYLAALVEFFRRIRRIELRLGRRRSRR